MKKVLTILITMVSIGLTACASMPIAKDEGEAKVVQSFAPVADKGVVYVYYDIDTQYAAYVLPVSIGDKGTVDTNALGYARVETNPGQYEVDVHTSEVTASIQTAQLTVKAGDVKFVRIKLIARPLIGAKGSVVEVSSDEAIAEIKKRKLTPLKLAQL